MSDPLAPQTRRQREIDPEAAFAPRLRPALLAPYLDLSRLRYDYPLILSADAAGDASVQTLSGAVDRALQQCAPRGIGGERLRQHVLRLEMCIRALAARGARGTLGELWDLAARELLRAGDEPSPDLLEESLARARSALRVDGRVVDCDANAPFEILTHLWNAVARRRVASVLEEIGTLEAKLADILRIDFLGSDDGRSPQRLQRSLGDRDEGVFDFAAWSRILVESSQRSPLSESRRRRIGEALAVLRSQRFFAPATAPRSGGPPPYTFVFDSCEPAMAAFRERLPEMVGLVKAIAIAKLEIDNHYREGKHDDWFRRFDESSLRPEDLAPFPSYLIRLRAKDCTAQERAGIFELLASGLPAKVVVGSDDILDGSMRAAGPQPVGPAVVHLAGMAVAVGETYVLQAASSSLHAVSDRIREGLARPGPALFSIFCGSPETLPELPPYLAAAAAMQSRAFPTFCYDPAAGGSWASRLWLDDNPQPDVDWPRESFAYQDEALQRISEDVAFTFADFAAADRRYARHVERIARSDWTADMVPVSSYLELDEEQARGKVPYVLAVDADDVLQRLAVDDALVRAARRCLERWRGLQQLGGIAGPAAPQPSEPVEAVEPGGAEAHAQAPDPQTAEADASCEGVEDARDGDDPYVETPRCTTCDECTQINPRMFAYDDNRQAYIADPDAGTYRELVEAAESCQVSIIHPGKPRNPKEPGLPELIGRAEPFR